jgi:SpoVK/Ycf46/Vps4 family AAA+-type ATPase
MFAKLKDYKHIIITVLVMWAVVLQIPFFKDYAWLFGLGALGFAFWRIWQRLPVLGGGLSGFHAYEPEDEDAKGEGGQEQPKPKKNALPKIEYSNKLKKKEERTLADCINDLNALVGLDGVKKEVDDLIKFVVAMQKRKAQGLSTGNLSYHMIMVGSPGTGKTTVCRIIGELFHKMGLLAKGHTVETDRAGLVASYVGQTAEKTKKVIESAMGGVLFIDEAYTLTKSGGQDFGQEAIDCLLKEMEDRRDQFIVCVAGYDKEMGLFVESNPGLKSRFNRTIHFEDYEPEDLTEIFRRQVRKGEYVMTKQAEETALEFFKALYDGRGKDFGNGRDVRNFYERVIQQQAKRGYSLKSPTKKDLATIKAVDIAASSDGKIRMVDLDFEDEAESLAPKAPAIQAVEPKPKARKFDPRTDPDIVGDQEKKEAEGSVGNTDEIKIHI